MTRGAWAKSVLRTSMRAALFVVIASFSLTTWLVTVGQAKKLDKEACKALQSERAEFLKSGILEHMSKGPDWVKDNLPFDDIKRIKRYLDLDGTVIFQCPNGGGPKITHKKKSKSGSQAKKKKTIRRKVVPKKKKTSSLSFDPFSGN